MKQATPKLYSRELADLLFEQPYCRIEHVMQRMEVSRITASKYLRELVKAGFVTREVQWKESLFINHRMMSLLGDW
jgi:Mn-dependent DtxR family transcriptional regulator